MKGIETVKIFDMPVKINPLAPRRNPVVMHEIELEETFFIRKNGGEIWCHDEEQMDKLLRLVSIAIGSSESWAVGLIDRLYHATYWAKNYR